MIFIVSLETAGKDNNRKMKENEGKMIIQSRHMKVSDSMN